MPLAITLRLDEVTASAINQIWQTLADRLGVDDSLRLGYHPHITLAILPDTVSVAAIEPLVGQIAMACSALPLKLAGLALFPGRLPVLWAAPVPTQRLLRLHRELHAALAGFPAHPHYQPDAWVPHVTLAKDARASGPQLLEAALSAWNAPVCGTLERLDLVRFRPVVILRSEPLAGSPERGDPMPAWPAL